MTVALRELLSACRAARTGVHYSRLSDKATEIVEHAIRHQVDLAFMDLRDIVGQRIVTLEYDVSRGGGASEETHSLLRVASSASTMVSKDIDQVLKGLQPLIAVATSLLSDMSRVFTDLVQGHLQVLLAPQ